MVSLVPLWETTGCKRFDWYFLEFVHEISILTSTLRYFSVPWLTRETRSAVGPSRWIAWFITLLVDFWFSSGGWFAGLPYISGDFPPMAAGAASAGNLSKEIRYVVQSTNHKLLPTISECFECYTFWWHNSYLQVFGSWQKTCISCADFSSDGFAPYL